MTTKPAADDFGIGRWSTTPTNSDIRLEKPGAGQEPTHRNYKSHHQAAG
jgi:hypothetical protein